MKKIPANKKRFDYREYRNRKGLSQGDMAREIGVSLNTYAGWEKGYFYPSEENAIKLVNFIGNKFFL